MNNNDTEWKKGKEKWKMIRKVKKVKRTINIGVEAKNIKKIEDVKKLQKGWNNRGNE